MNRFRWGNLAAVSAGLLIAACAGGKEQAAQSPLAPPGGATAAGGIAAGLPAPASLPRQAAYITKLSGINTIAQQGGTPYMSELILSLDAAPPTEVEPEPAELPLAFAIYQFDSLSSSPTALNVTLVSDYTTEIWVALADWDKGVWDFAPGSFYSSPGFLLGDFSGGPQRFISDDGRLAVALVLAEAGAPVRIQSLNLTHLSDISDFLASTNRWDGVELTWKTDADCDGYLLYRRVANPPPGEPWVALNETPLDRTVKSYLDGDPDGSTLYDYVIKAAYRLHLKEGYHWMYSPGVISSGRRQVTSVAPGPQTVAPYWPANLYNRVSFFWSGSNEAVEGVRNTSFPAGEEWLENDITALGGAPVQLAILDGFAPPFELLQSEEVNNSTLTVGYSTAAGTFAQVAVATADGVVEWEDPQPVREAGTYFLGFLQLPRRLACVTWNPQLGRVEMVDSIDMHGRAWYEFDPETFPWMLVTDRQPEGGVDMLFYTAAELMCYREAGTHEIVVLRHDFNIWTDMSPGLTCGPQPQLCLLMPPGQPSAFSLVYLREDGTRIRLVRQSPSGEWLTNEVEELVIAKPDENLSAFDLYTNGEVSYANYLAYILDGDLYMRYTNNPGLTGLGAPILVDSSGDVSGLDLIRIGMDEDFTDSNLFATYYSHDEDDVLRLNFRDLLALQPFSQ